MAVASAWAKPGSWALAAEEQDDLPPPPPPVPASDFPDLATAATTKVPKKKKPQPVSLASFNNGTAKFVAPSTRAPAPDVLLSLPTGPRERTEDELVSARWGRESSNDRQPRRGSGMDEFGGGPSRADGSDDWASDRRPMERRDRMGFGGDSRADDVDDWVSTKRAAAPAALPERRERSVAFGSDSLGRADEVDSWVSKKSYAAPSAPPSDGRRGSGGSVWGFNRDGGQEADSWARRREELGSGGGGSSAARPRLNLQKRTLPIAAVPVTDENKEAEKEEEEKKEEFQPKPRTSNPFGAARPREEVLAAKGETVVREEEKKEEEEEKPVIQRKVRFANPFGAARPREEVLAAKGEDWRKLDEKLDAMKVREAPPERRSFGRRGSPDAGEENGNGQVPESRAESAWRKPDAVEPTTESEPAVEPTVESEQGSETTEEAAPAN